VKIAYGLPFLSCPPPPELLAGEALSELARSAEETGFGAVFLTEHPAPSQRWRQTGGHDALDPFVGLAFAAAATTRLRLLTYLVVLPYRNPFLLAKSVSSLDRLSGGRVELGLGAGYQKAEFHALGVDFDERNELFDEALDVLLLAWSGQPVTFEGRHFSARDTALEPTPAQQPHPPLWFGGNSKLTRRRVAERGAGWMPMPNPRATAQHLRSPPLESIDDLAAMLASMRPPPTAVMYPLPAVRLDDQASVRAHYDEAARAAELGVTWCTISGQGRTMTEAREFQLRYRDAVLDRLSALEAPA